MMMDYSNPAGREFKRQQVTVNCFPWEKSLTMPVKLPTQKFVFIRFVAITRYFIVCLRYNSHMT